MPGMTGYFGLMDVGQPKAGETVVVSGAAGAVGQTVGQLAKIKGCRVVGIAGGPDKCRWVVDELGFDACIDYKSGNVRDGLKQHCPNGVDIYFDNVGGEILDHVLARINRKARIIICGAISQYNNTTPVQGPKNYLSLLVNRARMEGIVVFDYADRYPVAVAEMAGYLKDGRMKSKEDVVEGLSNFPATLLKLFNGQNFGKLVLQVAAEGLGARSSGVTRPTWNGDGYGQRPHLQVGACHLQRGQRVDDGHPQALTHQRAHRDGAGGVQHHARDTPWRSANITSTAGGRGPSAARLTKDWPSKSARLQRRACASSGWPAGSTATSSARSSGCSVQCPVGHCGCSVRPRSKRCSDSHCSSSGDSTGVIDTPACG
jgi:hypothetical protein